MNPYTVTPVTLSLHAFALRQRQEPRRHAKRLYAQVSLIVVPMVMFAGARTVWIVVHHFLGH